MSIQVRLERSMVDSQAKKDLRLFKTAIRTLIAGGAVQEYKIGNRNLKRYDLPDLIQLEGD